MTTINNEVDDSTPLDRLNHTNQTPSRIRNARRTPAAAWTGPDFEQRRSEQIAAELEDARRLIANLARSLAEKDAELARHPHAQRTTRNPSR